MAVSELVAAGPLAPLNSFLLLIAGLVALHCRRCAKQRRDLLEEDLNTPVRWVERAATSTWRNARESEATLCKRKAVSCW